MGMGTGIGMGRNGFNEDRIWARGWRVGVGMGTGTIIAGGVGRGMSKQKGHEQDQGQACEWKLDHEWEHGVQ